MSRKTNNLKKRMRIQGEAIAKREKELKRQEGVVGYETSRLQRESESIEKSAALTIRIKQFDRQFGDMYALQVQLRPEMFATGMNRNGFMNASAEAARIGYEVGRKIEVALLDFVQGKLEGAK